MLTDEQIFAAVDLKEQIVDVPEWGGSVTLRQITRKQQIECREQSTKGGEMDIDELELRMLIEHMVSPDIGQDRIEQLRGRNGVVLKRLADAMYALNGIGKGALEGALATFLD